MYGRNDLPLLLFHSFPLYGNRNLSHVPDMIRRVIPILLAEFVDGVINGASNFVTYLPQFFTEWEAVLVFVPVLVPFAFRFRVKPFSR